MSKPRRVAILGAGIMGSSTALLLARRGIHVTLFDAADAPFSAASRWNEGKIHLGFIYAADPSLKTARHVLSGGFLFKPLVEELLGCDLTPWTTRDPDVYLCHKDSVVSADEMRDYYNRVAGLIHEHPDASRYLVDVSDCRVERLASGELDCVSGSGDIVAGFRIPEYSVNTNQIADRYVDAVAAEPLIELRLNTRVSSVSPRSAGEVGGAWVVQSQDTVHGPFDLVVNALWEGRLPVDLTAGLKPEGTWSNRYRLALFARTAAPLDVSSAIIATGPFGDIKNYNGRDFYLSWYPSGLVVDSQQLVPPAPPELSDADKERLSRSILDTLGRFLPGAGKISEHLESSTLQGGWVFAAGQGRLSDPNSTLHRRSDFGMTEMGSYISVDTGKYSTAPWMAVKLAERIAEARS